jgi:hypothetical protein
MYITEDSDVRLWLKSLCRSRCRQEERGYGSTAYHDPVTELWAEFYGECNAEGRFVFPSFAEADQEFKSGNPRKKFAGVSE